jgi:hypothetical protein
MSRSEKTSDAYATSGISAPTPGHGLDEPKLAGAIEQLMKQAR